MADPDQGRVTTEMATSVSSLTGQKVTFTGIQAKDSRGNPTKLGGTPVLTVVSGSATGVVENYDEAAGSFDVALTAGDLGGANTGLTEFKLSAPVDLDGSGDAPIEETIAYVVSVPEASSFALPEPVIADI